MGRCKLTERELDDAMEYGPKTDRVSEVAKFETSESLSRCHLPASCTRLFQQSLHAFKINLLYDRALPLNMHNDAQFLKRLLLLADKVGKTAGQQLANSQK